MLTTIVAYCFTALLFAMIPGPDFALILRTSLVHGRAQSLAASVGVGCGLCVHTALSVLGLSAVIVHSPTLFAAITYAGAAYLGWIGLHALFPSLEKLLSRRSASKKRESRAEEGPRPSDARPAPERRVLSVAGGFRQGFLCNVLNPKALLFFLTFLPQFLAPSSPVPPQVQLLIFGLCSCVITGGWFVVLSLMLARLRPVFENPTFKRRLEQVTGIIFLGFCARLLWSRA